MRRVLYRCATTTAHFCCLNKKTDLVQKRENSLCLRSFVLMMNTLADCRSRPTSGTGFPVSGSAGISGFSEHPGTRKETNADPLGILS